jgi:hypothetical protein
MAFLDQTLRGKYNPRAYVPGGSSKAKAKSIQSKGYAKPKAKKPVSQVSAGSAKPSIANMLGAQKQQTDIQNRAPVSTQMAVSYESDPVLARIRALNQQTLANAQAEAESIKKKAVIDTGLADVGAQVGVDAGTLEAARSNPFSAAALLARESAERGRSLDEQLNQGNLFYSGHRANQLGELAFNTTQAQTGLANDLRSLLGQADQGVLMAQQQATMEEQAALEAAAEAARQEAFLQSLLAPAVEEPIYDDPLASIAGGGYEPVAADYYDPLDILLANQLERGYY